ncbi:MAG: hypothetical protein WCI17_08935 [bacterium]
MGRFHIRSLGWLLLACALAGGLRSADADATATDAFPVAVAQIAAADAAGAAIGRYLPIVSRMPFGVPPPPPAAPSASAPVSSASAMELGKSCVMSVLARNPAEEILVGFTDNGVKPPRNLLLAVGEEAEGYKVLAADFDHETATLEKDGARFELRLNAGLRALPAVYAADLGGARVGSIRLSAAGWTQLNAAGASGTSARTLPTAEAPDDLELSRNSRSVVQESFAASVRARHERLVKLNAAAMLQREQLAAARQQATAASEETARNPREASLNLLRKGLKPPEPIALTSEEDAKLVAEGVLPPQ